MTICRQYTLVKHHPEYKLVRCLKCRAWNCDFCAPERRAQLMALAASGEPQRFITLTINPRVGDDPESRLRLLARAWRLCVKRLRRLNPNVPLEYLAIVEETKKGEPHLHILARCDYIPQKLLSSIMAELIDSPIVDIRLIRNQGEVIRYVAKYITKAPKQFGRGKRYWSSRGYELEKPPHLQDPLPEGEWFEVIKRPVDLVLWNLACQGFRFRRQDDETTIAIPTFMDETLPYVITTGNVLMRNKPSEEPWEPRKRPPQESHL